MAGISPALLVFYC